MNKSHLITVVARDSPGVISRVAGLLRRKLLNIDSMTAGATHLPNIARFTVAIKGDQEQAHKAAKLIERLVEVRSVKILESHRHLQREIVLARFRITEANQSQLLHKLKDRCSLTQEITHQDNTITLELIDTPQNLETFLSQVKDTNIEILDWVRSGVITLEE